MRIDQPPVCDYEGSDYQASFWDSGGREYEDRVEAIALRRLLPRSGATLLELGAGAGRNTPRYSGFERVALLDYSLTQLSLARQRLGDDQRYLYVAANIYRLPFAPGVFDAATMIRTLHHMADAPLALSQVRQALRPGAVLILEFANKQNLKAILRYLLRRQAWNPFSLEPVEFAALNFDFHPRSIRAWLRQNDFDIQRQLTVSHFRLGLLKRLAPLRLLVAMDSLAQWSGGLWQLTPSVFVRAVAVGEAPRVAPGAFFRCPACEHYPLDESAEALRCAHCGLRYAIRDGVYDFREPIEA
ncbi:MAG: class I SAM-dependent methyltransferase [Anaerolineales bacterium]|nr:class I SAM-dependent methyltransferase [Anaerolineales bacterium]